MLNLSQIEADLVAAIKARDQLKVETLRGLKTRFQNEKISKMKDLDEADVVALVRSEVKRRKDAAEAFKAGGRPELGEKELREAKILEQYLPAPMPEDELGEIVEKTVAENNFSAKDFGVAMGRLKSRLGSQVDGAVLAKILKERLK